MRKRIVVKLFLLTAALCMLIVATILIGQTVFFKQYYANQKMDEFRSNIKSFEKSYSKNSGNKEAIQKLERDFYQKHRAWITTLDRYGNLKNANDFYLQVKLTLQTKGRQRKRLPHPIKMKVPLYNLMNVEGVSKKESPFSQGMGISIYGIKKDDAFVPYVMGELGTFPPGTFGKLNPSQLEIKKNKSWENEVLEKKVEKKLDQMKRPRNPESQSSFVMMNGIIKKVELPSRNEPTYFPYANHMFMERIKEFQADLLLDNNHDKSKQVHDYEQNGIKYKQLIKPIKDKNGNTTYIFSMVSLQPVGEAMQMLKDYYVYVIGFVLLLIFLASFYFSRTIARPLLRINKTTRKIANLDFSENVRVKSKDEIGDLSRNINLLSHTLHSHIEDLQQDIEKEKKLEKTRKAFISGVSHELKTPLSIMKSCISILKDGVASHKKDHYFQAIEKEVDKMDLLVVDMLELAKFESGTYKMKMAAFYIDEVIEDVRDQLSLEITRKEVNVYTFVDRVEVIANQQRIEQVLTNLMTNAIRYTPKGQNIIISTKEENQQVNVSVENKGTHIEADQLDKIWNRFYRRDSSRMRSEGGTGMGLAISRNILELHNVMYGAANTEDGVLFYFYLNKDV